MDTKIHTTSRMPFRSLKRINSQRDAVVSAVTSPCVVMANIPGGTISGLPLFLDDWTRTRDLPPVAVRTFQERWAAEREAAP